MTERPGADFDEHGNPPAFPADPPEGAVNASGPLPPRLQDDKPESPSADQNQWGGRPPAAGPHAFAGGPAPGSGNDTAYQWPDQPGSRRGAPSDDATAVAGRSRVRARTRGRGDALGPFPAGAGQEPGAAPGQLDAAQYGGLRSEPRQQPSGARPEDGYALGQAQGPAANWNYVDSIRSSELVPSRRIPPSRGWRKAVYVASFKLINLGWSPDERYQAELEASIRSLLRGTYKIGVLGKGGVGKSTIAASVGSVFAELRNDDRVVAIDADTSYGKLASRIDPSTSGSYWELASDRHLFSFADIRSRIGSNRAGLFVLAGDAATARRRVLDPAIYREATTQLDKHFTLSIVDCGSSLDSPVTQEVLAGVDALIVVSSPWYDGASAAAQALDWLANQGFSGLLHRTVVVVNDSDGHAARRDLALLVDRFGGRGQTVIEMPFDEHLRPGGVIDVKDDLNRVTRRRLMELATACAEHFTATADRPRRV